MNSQDASSTGGGTSRAACIGVRTGGLVVGSLGVVYGDIGTSPLYAFREAVRAATEGGLATDAAALGVLSLVTWALLLVITFKYVLVLLWADNDGEGGAFALMALAQRASPRNAARLLALGAVGAAFFFGDAAITPAISVLSAVEGLRLVAPSLAPAVLPVTLAILIALFAVQRSGTGAVARWFGPIMLVWFSILAGGGAAAIAGDASILAAADPRHGLGLLVQEPALGFVILGLVFLAITGGEALYTDLGHFGRRPIQIAWILVVLPALLLNYYGQGALIVSSPAALSDPFYLLYPDWALIPMVALATVATVIAAQAVITGAFSLSRQAIQLGLLPRIAIHHTSESMFGQIYLPTVNWMLLGVVILLVLLFETSSNLAAAYGVAVSADMAISTVMAFFVFRRLWSWRPALAGGVVALLLAIETAFFLANAVKLFQGAWLPLVIAAALATAMLTWRRGSALLAKKTANRAPDLVSVARSVRSDRVLRAPGTAVFVTTQPGGTPNALMHNLKHNSVLHRLNVVLAIRTEAQPRVARHERVAIERIDDAFVRVTARYGFMETPNVPRILEHCRQRGLDVEASRASFFLSHRSLQESSRCDLPKWQEKLFIWLFRADQDATRFFRIPRDRAIVIGVQMSL